MGPIAWIITGLIAGSLAQRVTGYEKEGCLRTLLLGISGGLLGGFIATRLFKSDKVTDLSFRGVFLAFVGASLICLVAGGIFGKKKKD